MDGKETSKLITACMAPDLPDNEDSIFPEERYSLYCKFATTLSTKVVVAEWLRRWTRNPLGSPRVGSNPADYGIFSFFLFFFLNHNLFTE